jgi:hypothetical protein
MSLLGELNRRNVTRVGGAYLAVSWLIVQVAETVLPVYGLGAGAVRAIITLLAIGLLPTLVFAWVFEITPGGLKRERDVSDTVDHPNDGAPTRSPDHPVLVAALTFFVVDRFVLEPDRSQPRSASASQRTIAGTLRIRDRSIAVLPFANMSGMTRRSSSPTASPRSC